MRCPYCGFEVAPTKFCENCGAPLPVEAELPAETVFNESSSDVTEPAASSFEPAMPSGPDQAGANAYQPYSQPTEPVQATQPAQPTQPMGSYGYQAPGQNAAPNAYQAGGNGSYTGAAQFSGSLSPNAAAAAGVGTVSNTAFGLAIAGLVLVVTGIGFFIGLILCIVALVMNIRNNKSGLANPHKTSTTVMSIIGIVLSTLTLIMLIMMGAVIAQIYPILERNDFDPSRIEIVVDDKTGEITVIEKPASSSGKTTLSSGASGTATTQSSGAASSSASSASSNDSRYTDSHSNPTLYAMTELNGQELIDALNKAGFEWDGDVVVWYSDDNGSLMYLTGPNGDLKLDDVKTLQPGATGKPVVCVMSLDGYPSPRDAFTALAKDVTVDKTGGDDDTEFAIVKNSKGTRFFVVAESASEGKQAIAIFNEEAIGAGMADSMLDVTVGTTLDGIWNTLEEMGYVSSL